MRKIKGGIAARDQAREKNDAEQGGGEAAIDVQEHLLAGNFIEYGQQGDDEKNSQRQGEQGHQHRLAEVLEDEIPAAGAHYLFDAHFFYPAGGLCRGQVHEVDAGNDQDDDRDDGKQFHIGDPSAGLNAVFVFAIEVPVRVAGKEHTAPIGLTLRLDEIVQLGIDSVDLRSFFYDHIGIGIAIAPVEQFGPSFQDQSIVQQAIVLLG